MTQRTKIFNEALCVSFSLIAAIFRVADVERHAADAGMAQLLSPELGTTLMWCLARWTQAYLGPCDSENLFVSSCVCLLC